MSVIESSIGEQNLINGLKEYFADWKFKHPYPDDLKASMERGSKYDLGKLFELLNQKGNFNLTELLNEKGTLK